MGLFQKKTEVSPVSLLYTIGTPQRKKLIIGLGNPGDEYADTRHNFGYMTLDKLAEDLDVTFVTKKDMHSQVAVIPSDSGQTILAKPVTFMNDSGRAVRSLMDFYQVKIDDVLVIHDELDIHLGEIRLKQGGGSAGHNGIKSIINTCGGDFYRLRIGIGPKSPEQIDSADFVLQKFYGSEKRRLPKLLNTAVENINKWLTL